MRRAVLIVKDDTILCAEMFPRKWLDTEAGRIQVAKSFEIPLQQAAILWAFGYADGVASATQALETEAEEHDGTVQTEEKEDRQA